MHIPDGYLSPGTCLALGAAVTPAWAVSAARLKARLGTREVPTLALGSAFSFVVMMFNVPAPGGTTGHAVGAGLVAILLGPAAAIVTTTVALAIQALLFGDGGVLTLGANCFNMAFLMPVATFALYRVLAAGKEPSTLRRAFAAGVSGWFGINVAALATAVELGLQPLLAHAADGTPLYCPYGLGASIPGMMLPHLLVFGPIEAVATAGVVAWAERTRFSSEDPRRSRFAAAWAAVAALCLLSPLGLLAAGDAWGEWGAEDLKAKVGFAPRGLERFGDLWKGLFPDYRVPGWGEPLGYAFSAVVGALVVGVLVWAIARLVARRESALVSTEEGPTASPAPPSPAPGLVALARGPRPGTLPGWLGARAASSAPCPCCGVSRGSSFAEKTVLGISRLARDSLQASRDASRPGVLQALDPRAKLAAALIVVVGVALAHTLLGLAGIAALALVLARASRLELRSFVARTWLVVPLFTGALVLPALLNAATPGPELVRLAATPGWLRRAGWPETLAVTTTGIRAALQLVLRVGASVSVVALVTRTTAPGEVLRALRALGVPRAFVLVATMTQRYILALASVIEEMHLALVSRRMRPLDATAGRAFVTSRMGVVLAKARHTADDVHLAMLARGFRGEVRTLAEPRLRARDGLAIGVAALASAGVVLLARAGVP